MSVSGARTPYLPLLPLWEEGAREDEGENQASGCGKTSSASQNLSTCEWGRRELLARGEFSASSSVASLSHRWQSWRCRRGEFSASPSVACPLCGSGRTPSPFSPCGRKSAGESHKRRFLQALPCIVRFRQAAHPLRTLKKPTLESLLPYGRRGRGNKGENKRRDAENAPCT